MHRKNLKQNKIPGFLKPNFPFASFFTCKVVSALLDDFSFFNSGDLNFGCSLLQRR